jgi:hypothetical protein
MKIGDLVRNKNSKSRFGLLLEWNTFDENTNPYTCPIVLWQDGSRTPVQASLLEVINENR